MFYPFCIISTKFSQTKPKLWERPWLADRNSPANRKRSASRSLCPYVSTLTLPLVVLGTGSRPMWRLRRSWCNWVCHPDVLVTFGGYSGLIATTPRTRCFPSDVFEGSTTDNEEGGVSPREFIVRYFLFSSWCFLLLMCVRYMTHSYPTGRKFEINFRRCWFVTLEWIIHYVEI